MRKLKRLTRKSLDELEKVMPTISELRQREFIGGDVYMSPTGKILHDTEKGSKMWIVDMGAIGAIEDSGMAYTVQDIKKNSTVFTDYDQTSLVRGTILAAMAQRVGFSGNIIHIHPGDTSGNKIQYGAADSSGNIALYSTSPSFSASNYYELRSLLVHEVFHTNDKTNVGTRARELAAYEAQMNHSSFKKTSRKFQNDMRKAYNSYK